MTREQKIELCKAQIEKYEYLKKDYYRKIAVVEGVLDLLSDGIDVDLPSFMVNAPLIGVAQRNSEEKNS